MTRTVSSALATVLLLAVAGRAAGQTDARLPLPVDDSGPFFSVQAPVTDVLVGLQWPTTGPLTSWAPVWSSLQADGTLKGQSTGAWTGPPPPSWRTLTRPGYVIGGFRFLMVTGPGPLVTQEAQIFWSRWNGTTGALVESPIYGTHAAPDQSVRVVEIRLPPGAIPIGFYGQTVRQRVSQASLLVRIPPAPPAQTPPAPDRDPPAPSPPQAPTVTPPLLNSPPGL